MDPITQQTALAAAGAGGEALYVDDVFSTYLYDGNGGNNPINNGIDLAGKGGMVWCKQRESPAEFGGIVDTERGRTKVLYPSENYSEFTTTSSTQDLVSFNSDGFTLGSVSVLNANHNLKENVSWTFRKAPGFFDIVVYQGDGNPSQTISHNLGSVPGCIIIKETDGTEDWRVYHRSLGATKNLRLNQEYVAGTNTPIFNDTEPTSTVFTVGNDPATNADTKNYVAYLFAHDDQSFGEDGDEAIIKCGSYSGTDPNGHLNPINLGFEPQWVMVKAVTNASDNTWQMYDVMRGINGYQPGGSTVNSAVLYAQSNVIEGHAYQFGVTPRGFTAIDSHNNNSSVEYIYIAIRRPHKPPESGTDVFAVESLGATSPSPPGWTSGFPIDWAIRKTKNTSSNWEAVTRVTGSKMYPNLQSRDSSIYNTNDYLDLQNGWFHLSTVNVENFSWMFKRAAGFFDVTTYYGTGGAHDTSPNTVYHNLGVTPELIIVKDLERSKDWKVWTTSEGDTELGTLNSNAQWAPDYQIKDVTSTTFKVGTDGAFTSTNYNNDKFVAYLFATRPGVSKIGTYPGTGNAQNVDCGFTNGARFVLTKRTDSSGDWSLFDTARGIVAGNDSRLSPNQPSTENSADTVDPYSQGFSLTTDQGDTNVPGGTYLFLAIA